jgi:hypothetical protein
MPKTTLDSCPSAPLLWHATRSSNVHWRWDDEGNCFQTHGWTRDTRYQDVRSWPAASVLSSVLRAIREDDRICRDPLIRLIGVQLAVEYLTVTVQNLR